VICLAGAVVAATMLRPAAPEAEVAVAEVPEQEALAA
jgi:hypothetical protein